MPVFFIGKLFGNAKIKSGLVSLTLQSNAVNNICYGFLKRNLAFYRMDLCGEESIFPLQFILLRYTKTS